MRSVGSVNNWTRSIGCIDIALFSPSPVHLVAGVGGVGGGAVGGDQSVMEGLTVESQQFPGDATLSGPCWPPFA